MKVPTKDFEIMYFKAERDFKSAQVLIESELVDQAICHFQQAREKTLKAYLIFNKTRILKSHDLTATQDSCIEIDGSFEVLKDSFNVVC
jgi:HEPN domain-containing protein